MPLVFITGPVRSGKSRFAERLVRERRGPVTYVATGRVDETDAEWVARIAHHRERRPPSWRLVETSVSGSADLPEIAREASPQTTLLVDSLGTWLAAVMARRFDALGELAALDVDAIEMELAEGVEAMLSSRAYVVLVGEESGWGLVPEYPSGRLFRDVLGRAQQRLATGAIAAYLVVNVFAIDLHAAGTPIDRERDGSLGC